MSGKCEEENVTTFGIRGFPQKCTCGRKATIYTAKTQDNPGRPFFRCPTRKDGHLFKWLEDEIYEEVVDILPRVGGIQYELEKVKSEIVETISNTEEQKQEFKSLTDEAKEELKYIIEQMKEEMVRNKMDLQRTKLMVKFCVGFLCVITVVIGVIIINGTSKNPHLVYGY